MNSGLVCAPFVIVCTLTALRQCDCVFAHKIAIAKSRWRHDDVLCQEVGDKTYVRMDLSMIMVTTTIIFVVILQGNYMAITAFSRLAIKRSQHAIPFHVGRTSLSRGLDHQSCGGSPKPRMCLQDTTGFVGGDAISDNVPEYPNTARDRAVQWINKFSAALAAGDVPAALDLFAVDPPQESDGANALASRVSEGEQQQHNFPPFWRDMLAYTWNIITLEGRDSIRNALEHTIGGNKKNNNPQSIAWKLSESSDELSSTPSSGGFPPPITVTENNVCEFWCDISTKIGTGRAHVRLNSDNQATTVLTVLMDLHDRPFSAGANRKRGLEPVPQFGRSYWSEHRQQHTPYQADLDGSIAEGVDDEESYYVAIIGGGQAGLSLGARLQLLEIPYVVLEAGPTPGWSWRKNRYPSLHLHDPAWYNHMPYLPYPPSWPIFAPKDKLADFLDMYAKVMDIQIRTSTKVVKAAKERQSGQKINKKGINANYNWKIDLMLMNDDSSSESTGSGRPTTSSSPTKITSQKPTRVKTIRANHLVFATGNSSHPKIPKIPGKTTFQGTQLHSSRYQGGRVFAGKRVVVVGSNNSAFDIVQDLWEQGAASVTMIQRSPSLVVSTTSVLQHGLGPLYSEDAKFHHEDADLIATTMPYKILLETRWKQVTQQMKETDAAMIHGLRQVGYQFDFGYKGTGLFAKSASEGGGFYINVGCAELLMQGKVHVRYATVERLEKDGVVILQKHRIDDDTENLNLENRKQQIESFLPADVIVYATGFDTMDAWVDRICGEDIARQVGKSWGLGLGHNPVKDPGPWEGELRNMWKPTNVDGLWFHGGNLAQARHYSRFLSLQLAARYLNLIESRSEDDSEASVYGIPKAVPNSVSDS